MKVLWICDPWPTINFERETTLRLIEESILLGHENWYADVTSCALRIDGLIFQVQKLILNFSAKSFQTKFSVAEPSNKSIKSFDHVMYRCDAPSDLRYIQYLQLLQAEHIRIGQKPIISNNPLVLMCYNSKTLGNLLPNLIPDSIISADRQCLQNFLEEFKQVVLKPLHEACSRGVELLDKNIATEVDIYERLNIATCGFSTPIVLQRYLSGTEGEVRLWYCKGQLIATGKKALAGKDFRFNVDHGDSVLPYKLRSNEIEISATIGKLLIRENIDIAAVDLLDEKIIDFNYTSPGLLIELEKTLGENLARRVITLLLGP